MGKIVNIFTHLSRLPESGVVHLKVDKIYSFEEFKRSHPHDHDELNPSEKRVVVSGF